MIIKPRIEPVELLLLRLLNRRMKLTNKEVHYYLNLEKGFKGEQLFDDWLKNLPLDILILNDLLLEYNNTVFQLDSLLITQDTLFLFEVKNYEGDYFIDNDKWYTLSNTEIKNPLPQLDRSESLLRRLLHDLGYTIPIESYLIFVNPNFYLYQAPINLPIIFSTQFNRLLTKINMKSSKLKERHIKLANQLIANHLEEAPYMRLPNYTFDQLKKGLVCSSCHTLITTFKKKVVICPECGHIEDIQSNILKSIEEFKLLFPNKKITTNAIHQWSGIQKKTVQRTLTRNFTLLGYGRSSNYVKSK